MAIKAGIVKMKKAGWITSGGVEISEKHIIKDPNVLEKGTTDLITKDIIKN